MWRRRCFHGINAMILMPQIFDVIANENACYKRNELEYDIAVIGSNRVKFTTTWLHNGIHAKHLIAMNTIYTHIHIHDFVFLGLECLVIPINISLYLYTKISYDKLVITYFWNQQPLFCTGDFELSPKVRCAVQACIDCNFEKFT